MVVFKKSQEVALKGNNITLFSFDNPIRLNVSNLKYFSLAKCMQETRYIVIVGNYPLLGRND